GRRRTRAGGGAQPNPPTPNNGRGGGRREGAGSLPHPPLRRHPAAQPRLRPAGAGARPRRLPRDPPGGDPRGRGARARRARLRRRRVPRRAGGVGLSHGAGEHGPGQDDPAARLRGRRGRPMSRESAFSIPPGRKRAQTLIAHVEDEPGTLNRITSLFRRRGFNIESLTVGRTEREGVSRITVVVRADDDTAHRLEANLYKLVNVLTVEDVTHTPSVT